MVGSVPPAAGGSRSSLESRWPDGCESAGSEGEGKRDGARSGRCGSIGAVVTMRSAAASRRRSGRPCSGSMDGVRSVRASVIRCSMAAAISPVPSDAGAGRTGDAGTVRRATRASLRPLETVVPAAARGAGVVADDGPPARAGWRGADAGALMLPPGGRARSLATSVLRGMSATLCSGAKLPDGVGRHSMAMAMHVATAQAADSPVHRPDIGRGRPAKAGGTRRAA